MLHLFEVKIKTVIFQIFWLTVYKFQKRHNLNRITLKLYKNHLKLI